MRQFVILSVLMCFGMFLLTSCGGEEKKEESGSLKDAQKQLAAAGEKFAKSMKEMSGSNVEPVHFSKLKEFFPETVGTFNRKTSKGNTTKAMGINVSEASARYENEDGTSMKAHLTDMGNMSGLTAMAAAAWAFSDFDNESDDGYERTIKLKGFKALEKYKKGNRHSEISVLIADRFVLEVDGYDVNEGDAKKFAGQLDLEAIGNLKE